MKFSNWINFKFGKIRRGDYCLYAGLPAFYLGSYKKDDEPWMHMFLVSECPGGEDQLIHVQKLDYVTHHSRQRPATANQLLMF